MGRREPAGEAGEPLRRGFAICGEPRCGSTYLARLLKSTDMLGRPFELFRTQALVRAAERDPEGALAAALDRATTPNGVYGFKIFTRQFDLALRTRWAERLPGLKFVHLERLDLLGHAISLVRVRQTNQFHADQEPQAPPRYDGRALDRALEELAWAQGRWRTWFARNGIEPLRLTYEAIAAGPEAAVAAVARHMGVEPVPRPALERVTLRIQRDETSEQWRRRFLEDHGDLSRLGGRGFSLVRTLRRLRSRLR